jgi:hypothetical protein
VNIDAQIGGKHLLGEFTFSKQNFSVKIDGDGIPAGKLPTREYAVFPIAGNLDVHVNLESKIEKNKVDWSKLVGKINLRCPKNCQIGDGSYVKFPSINARNDAMVGKGVEFAPLMVDSFVAQVDMAKGVAKMTKWDFKSEDGEAKLEAEVKLDKVFDNSIIDGCVRYKPSDVLRKRQEKTFNQIMLIGGLLGADGMFQVRLSDRMGRIRKVGQECTNIENAAADKKPNLTVTPDGEVFGAKAETGNGGQVRPVGQTPAAPAVPAVAPTPTPSDVTPAGGSATGSAVVPATAPIAPEPHTKPLVDPIPAKEIPAGEGTAGAAGVGNDPPAQPAPPAENVLPPVQ